MWDNCAISTTLNYHAIPFLSSSSLSSLIPSFFDTTKTIAIFTELAISDNFSFHGLNGVYQATISKLARLSEVSIACQVYKRRRSFKMTQGTQNWKFTLHILAGKVMNTTYQFPTYQTRYKVDIDRWDLERSDFLNSHLAFQRWLFLGPFWTARHPSPLHLWKSTKLAS